MEEDSKLWTESVRSKEGAFAVSIDVANKRILLMRADDRALGALQLRVRLIRVSGPPLEVVLRDGANPQAPWRYGAKISGDEAITGFELEGSQDGHTWRPLGKFLKSPAN